MTHIPDSNQERCLQTWLPDTRPLTDHFSHMAMGLASEAGEFVGLIDKQLFKPSKLVTPKMLQDELGDVLYYVTIAAHLLGMTIEELYAMNAEKLAGGHGWVKPPTMYNWDNAPERATHAAMDATGDAFWYAPEPQISEPSQMWLLPMMAQGTIEIMKINKADILHRTIDWRQSLEARPK